MGKWATYRRRGGGTVPPFDAPVLAMDGTDAITWSWTGANPDHWSIEEADAINGPWQLDTPVPGTDRSANSLEHHPYYRIIGLDALENPVTNYSNVVHQP